MMSTNVGIWFECKTCKGSFRNLEDFLTHKKLDHLEEFQNTNYIIFEERRIQEQCNDEQIVSVSPTAQGHEQGSTNELIIDPSQVKFENEYYDEDGDHFNSPEFPWESFTQNAELIETDHDQSIGQEQNSSVLKTKSNFKSHNNPCLSPQERILAVATTQTVKNKTRLIKCQLCLDQFKSEPELAVHLNSCYLLHSHCHDRFCVLCNTKFSNKANLKRHISRRHITNKPKSSLFGLHSLQCSKNVKKEVNANGISQPINLVYIDFQQFKCPHIYCEKSFTTEYHLQKHLISHANLVTKTLSD